MASVCVCVSVDVWTNVDCGCLSVGGRRNCLWVSECMWKKKVDCGCLSVEEGWLWASECGRRFIVGV